MRKNLKSSANLRKILCGILILAALSTCALLAFADGEFNRGLSVTGVTVTVGGKTIENAYSDPVNFYEEAASGYLTKFEIQYQPVADADTVIYTALYPDTTTGRTGAGITEYTCEPDGGQFRVTAVNTVGDGKTYIPVGGFVLSVSESANPNFAQVGDAVVLGGEKLTIPTKAVESDAGKRIAVDYTNVTRSAPMVVYYDYQFGAKTGTNIFGTEMTCVYNFEDNTFRVASFRGFGTGDDSGSEIPDNSFVLSAYGEGYRQLLVKGELFQVGDNVKMVGFDFIRFGGTVRGEYHFIDPTPESNPAGMETETTPFDAYRGENQTIIYKHGWSYNGSTGTGTNIYGYEAAVNAEGVVVEIGVNVSEIPEGGYVISGHGKGRDFIRSNIVLGATVVLDEATNSYTVSTTLNSYYENLVTDVNSTITVAENRIRQLYDIDVETINGYITEAKAALAELKTVKERIEAGLDAGNWTEQQRLSNLMEYNNYQLQVERLQRKIQTGAAESKPVSARAVWHRPIEMSYEQIQENVSMYAEIGINTIFVETWYNGYSSFRSDYADFPYNPKLSASYTKDGSTVYPDYLTAFVACCQEYDIEVHAWVENFYVGTLDTVPIVANHPDWIMYNDDGTIYQRNEGGAYIFLDPANKNVQDALISYYLNLFQKVPGVAGLNLDYIRYPVTDAAEDSGYTIEAMEGFAALKGITFTDAQKADREKMARKFKQLFNAQYLAGGQAEADANYDEWVDYRIGIVTEYVRRIKLEVKDTQDIVLSTSVFASVTESLHNKKQDWKTWFANGWIDIATPMAYYTDASDVLKNVTAMIQSAGNICYYYTGLASSYSGLPAWQNKEQIEASYLAGANGYVIFCSTQIIGHADVQEVLMAGVNSTTAVRPHDSLDKVLQAYFDRILDRAQRLYIPAGGMTEEQYQQLQAKFEEIKAMPTDGAVNIYKIQKAIQGLYGMTGTSYAKGYSSQRMVETFKEMVSLLDSRMSIFLVESGDWNPEENPVRPTVTEDGIKQPEANKPATPVNPNPTTPNKSDPAGDKQSNEEFFGKLWVILAVAMVVMMVTGVAIFQMARRKKPADPDQTQENA